MTPSGVLEPDPREPVIEVRGLTRFFGRKCAVDGISFRVPRGSVFGFIGRNGAAKTTTIRMFLGLLEPTRGSSMCQVSRSMTAGMSPAWSTTA